MSRFAQDYLLRGLNGAHFELTPACKPMLRKWAERVTELREEYEDSFEETESDPESDRPGREDFQSLLASSNAWRQVQG